MASLGDCRLLILHGMQLPAMIPFLIQRAGGAGQVLSNTSRRLAPHRTLLASASDNPSATQGWGRRYKVGSSAQGVLMTHKSQAASQQHLQSSGREGMHAQHPFANVMAFKIDCSLIAAVQVEAAEEAQARQNML